jgi:hypothetical protein
MSEKITALIVAAILEADNTNLEMLTGRDYFGCDPVKAFEALKLVFDNIEWYPHGKVWYTFVKTRTKTFKIEHKDKVYFIQMGDKSRYFRYHVDDLKTWKVTKRIVDDAPDLTRRLNLLAKRRRLQEDEVDGEQPERKKRKVDVVEKINE